jgi:D-alanyl-D-alanine carboxypeptidase (penicillin-binding protein 5/6)
MPARRSHRHRTAAVALTAAALTVAVFGTPAGAGAKGPKVGAPSAILVEPATGDIVYARRASQQRPIASTTKMMTALVTLDHANLNDTFVTVPYRGLAVESTAGFRGGERVKVRDLLRALLVASANDAAQTLAVRVGGSTEKFVAMMNARARRLGLTHTHFANPIGLDAAGNYSSATDLVKMGLILRMNAFARATMNLPKVTLQSGAHKRTLKNRDTLIGRVPFMNGIKTGHTQTAGYILVGSASRRGVTLVSAVLATGSDGARNADTLALMRYGFKRYQAIVAVKPQHVYATVGVKDHDQRVDLVSKSAIRRVVRRGQKITTKPVVPDQLTGPLAAGAKAGTLNVIYRRRVVDRVPLVTTAPVAAPATAARIKDDIIGPAGLVVAVVVACTLYFVLRRRRAVKRRRQAGAADSEARIA